MTYKLLAVDIDGTLLNSEGLLTDNTKNRIRQAIEKNVVFVICTGRPIQGVTDLNDEIGYDLPYITYNGAMIVMGKSKEILYEKSLNKEYANKIYNYGEQNGITIIIWANNKLYVNKINEKSLEYGSLTNTECNEISSLDQIPYEITKMLWFDEHEILMKHYDNMKDLFCNDINIHFSRPYFLEFVDKNATKGLAIEKLCDYYGFNYNETIAIGDGENDLSMIRSAGLGVAMENAPMEVQKAAKYVTKSCDQDGVAFVIEQFLLEGIDVNKC